MTIVCWSVKGGSGTTVVAAVLGVLAAERGPCIVVDLAGDLPATFGIPEPDGPGVSDWLAAEPGPAPGSLVALARPVRDELRVVPFGGALLPADDHPAWPRLADELAGLGRPIVVDAGRGRPPTPLVDRARSSLLVLRPCFLALRRAALLPEGSAGGVVLIEEPGRSLSAGDVSRTLGIPIVARLPLDPALARSVDAGLLLGRIPAAVSRALRSAT